MANMDKIFYPVWLIVECFRLSQFILMMREDKIDSTWMNVKVLSQNFTSHCWAFNMPARSSITPWWRPKRFFWFNSFPKCKIFFVPLFSLLISFLFFSLSFLYSFQLSVFEFFLIGSEIKIYWAIGRISISILNNPFNKLDDFRHKLGNSCQIIWIFNSQLSN